MRTKNFSIVTISLLLMVSCGGCKKTGERIEPEKSKTLVLYYSQTGTTRQVADEIQKQLGADIDSIVPLESYGYDYDATIQRWLKEREDSVKVAIKPQTLNVNDYDTIFLGFPIWGGTYASPVATWLEDNKLDGKEVITFATFGSGGLEPATVDVRKALPSSNIKEGYGVRTARITKSPSEINRFLIENGYKRGEIEKLPDYGPMAPVTPEETEVFNQACGDYRFPLGSPVNVSSRTYNGITDYKYEVNSTGPDGNVASSVIYVKVEPEEKAVFTRVVRQ